MSNNNFEEGIFKKMIQAQIGTLDQSNLIEDHMKEYFTRFQSYKDKFTYLEWYHIFLDFLDKIPTPSPKDQPEGQKTLRWVKASERFPIKPDNYAWKYYDEDEPSIIFVNRVHDASFVWFHSIGWDVKDHTFFNQQEGWDLSQWEWLEEITETPQTASEAGMSQEDFDRQTRQIVKEEIEWDSLRLIGRVRERHKELIEKGWDWRSFYNGWLEGRVDMWAQNKGIAYPNELPEEPAPILQGEIPEEIEKWIEEEGGNEDFAIYWRNGAIACYYKMQEEIQDYRKALEDIRDNGGGKLSREDRSRMIDIATKVLAKYPQGKEGGK